MKLHVAIVFCIAILLNAFQLFSQSTGSTPEKEIRTAKLLWFDFSETIKFNNKWNMVAEYNPRFNLDPTSVSQNVVRTYGLFNIGENWSIGQGFVIFFNNQNGLLVHELRPETWFFYKQQFEKAKNLGIVHRFRVEERFTRNTASGELADGYNFTMRYRYRFGLEYTLARIGEKKNPLKCFVNDEIFLQSGKTIVYNVFEQNRFIAGFSYRLAKGFTAAFAYMNIFRQMNNPGYVYTKTHTFRISFLHEFSLKEKKD